MNLGVSFLIWVFRSASNEQIEKIGSLIYNAVVKLLKTVKMNDNSFFSVRSLAFSSFGVISNRAQKLFSSDLDTLSFLIEELRNCDDVSTATSIKNALFSICPAYISINPTIQQNLIELLFSTLLKVKNNSDAQLLKFIIANFANRIFPFSNAKARMIDLILSDDQKQDVSNEAKRGLEPYKQRDGDIESAKEEDNVKYPDFNILVDQVMNYLNTEDKELEKQAVIESMLKLISSSLKFISPSKNNLFRKQEITWEALTIAKENHKSQYETYVEFIEKILKAKDTNNSCFVTSSQLLLELCLCDPKYFSLRYSKKEEIKWLYDLAFKGWQGSRENVSKIWSVLLEYLIEIDSQSCSSFILETIETVSNPKTGVEALHSSLLFLGYTLGSYMRIEQSKPIKEIEKKDLQRYIHSCYKNLQHSVKIIQQTSVKSLGIFSRYKALQFENVEEKLDTNSIFDSIEKFISSNNKDRNLLEVSISSLKSFILGSEESNQIDKLCEILFSLSKYEQEDLHFTISETLCCVSGWVSDSAPDVTFESSHLIEKLRENKKKNADELVEKVLSHILKETLSSGKIQERCAASIWLLGFVNFAGKNTVVQKKLNNIQAAFSLLLSDPNQITQEVASKGLVLLYEIGSEESKKMLIEDLVMTLQTGKTGFKVTSESEVQLEGEIGKDLKKKGFTTYKELSNLAKDVGKPNLLFQLMNLASHHAIWNSKSAAAYSASSVFKIAGASDQLKPLLPKLLPKIYRSCYDPDQKVSKAFQNSTKKNMILYLFF